MVGYFGGRLLHGADKSLPEPLRLRLMPHDGTAPHDVAPMPRQATVVDGNISVPEDGKHVLIGLLDRSWNGLILADLK